MQVHLRQVQAGQVQPSTVKQPWQVQLGAGTAYCIQLGSVAIQAANSLPKLSTREGNKSWSPFLHVIFFFNIEPFWGLVDIDLCLNRSEVGARVVDT